MIYEYKCDIHGVFETQQSVKDEPLDRCPKCVEEGLVEYHCEHCNSTVGIPDELEIDHIYHMDRNNIICKGCGAELAPQWRKPKKLISLSSFSLRGGGWASSGYSK